MKNLEMNIECVLADLSMKNTLMKLEAELAEYGVCVIDVEDIINRSGYIVAVDKDNDNKIVGFLRYNYFWDTIPFCNKLFVLEKYRGNGIGTALMAVWKAAHLRIANTEFMVSTQANESAIGFYTKLGYQVCGSMTNTDGTTELFMRYALSELEEQVVMTANIIRREHENA